MSTMACVAPGRVRGNAWFRGRPAWCVARGGGVYYLPCMASTPLLRPGFAAVVACLALAGCSEQERGGRAEPVRVGIIEADPARLRPSGPFEQKIARETTQGLLTLDATGQVAPGLARSWNISGDGLRYVFRLRPDARWSDGEPISADAVTRSLERSRKAMAKTPDGLLLGAIERVTAPAPGVVEISLLSPTPSLLQTLALPALAIRERKRAAPGPFVRAAEPAVPARLEPNTEWTWPDGAPGGATITPLTREEAIARFRQMRLDIVTGSGLSGFLAAREAGARSGAFRVEAVTGHIALRFGSEPGMLADDRLRAALSLSIDRDGIAPLLFVSPLVRGQLSLGPPTLAGPDGLVVPGWAGLPIDARRRAAAILASYAELSPEQPLTITIDAPDTPEHAAILRVLSESWAPLGLTVRARMRGEAAHAAFVEAGAYQLALVEEIAPVPSAIPFIDSLRCGKLIAAICDAEADALWDRYLKSRDAAARTAAEEQWQTRTPIIPLFTAVRWSLVSPAVSGWVDNPLGSHPVAELSVKRQAGQ